jgi:hypothetical protein
VPVAVTWTRPGLRPWECWQLWKPSQACSTCSEQQDNCSADNDDQLLFTAAFFFRALGRAFGVFVFFGFFFGHDACFRCMDFEQTGAKAHMPLAYVIIK